MERTLPKATSRGDVYGFFELFVIGVVVFINRSFRIMVVKLIK